MSNVEAQFAEYVRVLMLRQRQWADAQTGDATEGPHEQHRGGGFPGPQGQHAVEDAGVQCQPPP